MTTKTLSEKYAKHLPCVGCHVDGSASSADYLNERIVSLAVDYGFDAEGILDDDAEEKHGEDYGQFLNETADDAVDYLNELETRPYMAWTVDDNSLFLVPCVDNAREDVGFVSGHQTNALAGLNPDGVKDVVACLVEHLGRMERRYIQAELEGNPIPESSRDPHYKRVRAALAKLKGQS